ncbi:MAG: hypothetical protein SGILL_010589 [Bacillariaceae sp.]
MLKNNYRGTLEDGSVDHEFNYFNAFAPTDDTPDSDPSATFIASLAVGPLGAALDADFINCKCVTRNGLSQFERIFQCAEWILEPSSFELGEDSADADRRPHIAVMPFALVDPLPTDAEVEQFRAKVRELEEAGVFVVAEASDVPTLSRCSFINKIPGNVPEVFTASHLLSDLISLNPKSASGPGSIERSVKPDLTAAGTDVVGAVTFDQIDVTARNSGSGPAAAVIAGCVALMWQAVPEIRRNVPLTKRILAESSTYIDSDDCLPELKGPDENGNLRNNVFGYGRLECDRAVELARELFPPVMNGGKKGRKKQWSQCQCGFDEC